MTALNGEQLVTIRGLAIPVEWDDGGGVIAIAINTFDEDEFIVENTDKATILFRNLREKVEVSGTLFNKNRKKYIRVEKVRMMH